MVETASPPVAAGYGISPRTTGEPPEGELREVALLRADTPEAAAFFQRRGDMAGRELRHRCQARIDRTVSAHGGRIARTAGDVSWAYFSEPEDALSAALSLLEKFQEPTEDGDRVGVRIGLHFGEVILERRDLVGRVVHQLDRLVQSLETGRIGLTADFRDSRWRNGTLPFGLRPLASDAGTGFFLAERRMTKRPEPAGTIQLRLEPLWALAPAEFGSAWNALAAARESLRANPPVTSEILPDGVLRFFLDDPGAAARLGLAALDYLAERMGPAAAGCVPVRATVDGSGGNVTSGDDAMPGEIYLTPPAMELDASSLSVEPVGPPGSPPPAYRYRSRPPETPTPFRFAAALGAGPHPPCFHCGACRHLPAACPTRRGEDRSDAIERLGYLHPNEINHLFLRFLTGDSRPLPDGAAPRIAGEAFASLKRVHQLRFFRLLWRSAAERWDDVGDPRFLERKGRGGRAWLALDCLQNGRLQEAEDLLNTALKASPSDAKIHAAFGFLAVERENRRDADENFDQALFHARSVPERIFFLLQRYRLARLDDRPMEMEKFLERALAVDADCGDVLYESALLRLAEGAEERGIDALLTLAEDDRKFYLRALIDPELAPWFVRIRDGLGRLYRSARDDAAEWMPQAGDALGRARELLGAGDRTVAELTTRFARLTELRNRGGYFGLLDAADGARTIVARADRTVRLRREGLFDLLNRQENRLCALDDELSGARPGPLADRLRAVAESIRSEISFLKRALRGEEGESLRSIADRLDELDALLSRAEFRFRVWGALRQGLRFLGAFSKISLVLQSLNLLFGLLLVPVVIRLLAMFMENWQVPLPYLRLSQMGTLLVGGLFGFLVAVFKGLQKMDPDGRPSDS